LTGLAFPGRFCRPEVLLPAVDLLADGLRQLRDFSISSHKVYFFLASFTFIHLHFDLH
jgi:hypothetical protein